ncbi:MlaD family protein [Nocardia vaccinii]|uniref:MlaD family protein n=1 Tax=Nocardia vaccinii TaxID=1822 RepID=UPI000829AE8A|nr:MlaD family protein [Nocardia vaccinii]
MKTPRQAALRLAVLAAVVVVITMLIVQAVQRPVGGATTTYRARFGDVFGLQVNDDVRLRGVQIGKVTGSTLTPDNRALITFTVRAQYRLRDTDQLAVKFQNLTGQRYLELIRGTDGRELPADGTVTHTVDSFGITTVFNGLRPLLNDADPAVYNRLARSIAAMIDGSGDDMAPVLRDVATLAGYAKDRTALLKTIIDNLQSVSDRLGGHSRNLDAILQVFHSIFMPIAGRMSEFLSLMNTGSAELTEVVRLVDSLSLIFLGARDHGDDLTRRIDEAIPDTRRAVHALSMLPGLLAGLNRLVPATVSERQCGKGTFQLPLTANVLLAGRQLTICNGSGR